MRVIKDIRSTNIIIGHLRTAVIPLRKAEGITKREMQVQKETKRSITRGRGHAKRLKREKKRLL